jgi:hypothetical protein
MITIKRNWFLNENTDFRLNVEPNIGPTSEAVEVCSKDIVVGWTINYSHSLRRNHGSSTDDKSKADGSW